jgi:hypothetical protein
MLTGMTRFGNIVAAVFAPHDGGSKMKHVIVTSPDSPGQPFLPRLAVIAIPDLTDPRQVAKALVLSRQPFTYTNGTGGWPRWNGQEARLDPVGSCPEVPQGTPEVSWAELVDEALAEERAGRTGPSYLMDGPVLSR